MNNKQILAYKSCEGKLLFEGNDGSEIFKLSEEIDYKELGDVIAHMLLLSKKEGFNFVKNFYVKNKILTQEWNIDVQEEYYGDIKKEIFFILSLCFSGSLKDGPNFKFACDFRLEKAVSLLYYGFGAGQEQSLRKNDSGFYILIDLHSDILKRTNQEYEYYNDKRLSKVKTKQLLK